MESPLETPASMCNRRKSAIGVILGKVRLRKSKARGPACSDIQSVINGRGYQ